MKKTLLSILGLVALVSVDSQAQITDETNFVGALHADANADWTKKWTNWNPKNTNYPAVTDTVTLNDASGVKAITGTLTLDASKVYKLKSVVSVEDGGVLVIPAGTIIRGQANTTKNEFASIVVTPGGKIIVDGTADNPVVMTSNLDGANRDRGNWGGLALFGKAINNQGQNIQMEGFSKLTFYKSGLGGTHGGNLDTDSSGSIKYLRVEFAGFALDVNKEINAVTFGSIGKKTKVDYVQASYSGDDSFEWFGGSLNSKHLIAFATTDDDFDTDFGFHGSTQYGIGYRLPEYFDLSWKLASGASTSEGFESDNDANGSALNPKTSAVFSNFTMVGPVKPGGSWSTLFTDPNDPVNDQKSAFRRGARLRRNTQESILNSIFLGYRNFLMIEGTTTLNQAGVTDATMNFADSLQFQSNYIAGTDSAYKPASATANGLVEVASGGPLSTLDTWIKDAANYNSIHTSYEKGEVLVELNNLSALDFRPVLSNTTVNSMARWASVKVVDGVEDDIFVNNRATVYPNPSNGSVNVAFETLKSAVVTVEIFDLLGNKVATLNNSELAAGDHLFTSNQNLSAGVYVVKISTNKTSASAKLVVE